MHIHQFIPYLHPPGDAAADQVYAFQRAFRAWGYESEVFALGGEPEVEGVWRPASAYPSRGRGTGDDVLVYHYVMGSPLTAMLRGAAGRLLLFYHNVTPPAYIAPFHPELALSFQAGRDELQTLCHVPALAPSEYSRQELQSLGFRHVQVVPLLLDFDRLHASAQAPAGRKLVQRFVDGWVNWVSVGRVVPNKRCEHILKAFAYYQRVVNPHSRLFMVGSIRHFEAYQFALARMAWNWDLDEVYWCDRVAYEEGFGAYYQLASAYVSMSEHEGFCAPLLEAMSFDVPVVAYSAAAVPFTVGDAGVLVHAQQYEAIAELVALLQQDAVTRAQIVATQRRRLEAFAPERVLAQLEQAILGFLRGDYEPD